MRLAVSGTHCSGKTTLIEDFLAAHPDYGHEPEPYESLSEAGVAFSDPPTVEDYLQQLEYSIETLHARAAEENVIFDRCPIDFVAYLKVLSERSRGTEFETGSFLEGIEDALQALDMIVFLPLCRGDEIANLRPEYPELRRLVDRELKLIIRDDDLALLGAGHPRLLELKGTPSDRLEALERAISE